MNLLEVRGLTKKYDGFLLDDVSFSLMPGYIMGFIGRNGAGKTTTIKAILNLIHRDKGEVYVDGKDFFKNETELKKQIGFVMGEFDCYKKAEVKKLTDVMRRFYPEWDEDGYRGCLEKFSIDENKKISELSAGMRVKYALSLALSHNAKLLIFDEPTSGLDPVSRDELLDVFRSVISDGEHGILFSTHIISDLEKCADQITYIKKGRLLASTDLDAFRESRRLVSGELSALDAKKPYLIGYKQNAFGFTGLIYAEDEDKFGNCRTAPADLESIMIYTEQEEK